LLSCKTHEKIKSRQQRPKRYGAVVALLEGSQQSSSSNSEYRKMQSSFLNSHENQSEAAAAAKQFFNQRNIPAAFACTKKTNDRFSSKTLFTNKTNINTNYLSASNQPVIYLFCADTHTISLLKTTEKKNKQKTLLLSPLAP
jgi:hypothetical protein